MLFFYFFRNPYIAPAFMLQNPWTVKSRKAQVWIGLGFFLLILLSFSLLGMILQLPRLKLTVALHVPVQPHSITHISCRAGRGVDSL